LTYNIIRGRLTQSNFVNWNFRFVQSLSHYRVFPIGTGHKSEGFISERGTPS
jgi:hypothetical protein